MTYRLGKYIVIKRADGWNIEADEGWCYHHAVTDLWWPVEPFDTFDEAVNWLKENKDSLL